MIAKHEKGRPLRFELLPWAAYADQPENDYGRMREAARDGRLNVAVID